MQLDNLFRFFGARWSCVGRHDATRQRSFPSDKKWSEALTFPFSLTVKNRFLDESRYFEFSSQIRINEHEKESQNDLKSNLSKLTIDKHKEKFNLFYNWNQVYPPMHKLMMVSLVNFFSLLCNNLKFKDNLLNINNFTNN